jgi:hypothetical protein
MAVDAIRIDTQERASRTFTRHRCRAVHRVAWAPCNSCKTVDHEASSSLPSTEELEQRLVAAIFGTPDTTYGTIFRMTDDELLACFGTSRATHEPDASKLSIAARFFAVF